MELLSSQKYLMLCEGSEIIARDPYGDKVLGLRDGSILKLFRVKHLISSARLYPYSLRFVDNAKQLSTLEIQTVEVLNSFKIPSINRTAVQYVKLEGETLPTHLSHKKLTEELAQKFGSFVATLHNKGVYFRSIHLENIIVLQDESFGLIDVSDMKIYSHSLSPWMRNRNFKHLTRYASHRDLIKHELTIFIQSYLDQSKISDPQHSRLKKKLLRHFDVC